MPGLLTGGRPPAPLGRPLTLALPLPLPPAPASLVPAAPPLLIDVREGLRLRPLLPMPVLDVLRTMSSSPAPAAPAPEPVPEPAPAPAGALGPAGGRPEGPAAPTSAAVGPAAGAKLAAAAWASAWPAGSREGCMWDWEDWPQLGQYCQRQHGQFMHGHPQAKRSVKMDESGPSLSLHSPCSKHTHRPFPWAKANAAGGRTCWLSAGVAAPLSLWAAACWAACSRLMRAGARRDGPPVCKWMKRGRVFSQELRARHLCAAFISPACHQKT